MILKTVSVSVFLAAVSASVAELPARAGKPLASWVVLEKFSGEPGCSAITQTEFRQLVYELQQQRQLDVQAAAPGARAPDPAGLQVYEQIAAPRNNARQSVALSVIHWNRTVRAESSDRTATGSQAQAEPVESSLTVFAFAPIRATTYRGSYLEMTIHAADLFEEGCGPDQQIAEFMFDGGDGQGRRAVRPGGPVAVAYGSAGWKELKLEATLADGTVLYAASALNVAALATPLPDQTVSLQADDPYAGYSGLLYVYKSGSHTGLKCPVLVVEGFDLNNDMDWDVLYNILNKETLAESLRACGRDLVVLDFDDATADIFGNARLAMQAVGYINSNRYSPSDKFTVIGASMGGLVTRNALALMDRYPAQFGDSEVDTWISFDSPHTGANLPLGVQEYFNFFGGFAGDYSDLAVAREYREKLDSPAARQMLLCHYTHPGLPAGSSPLYDGFWDSMNSSGYPVSGRNVAVSNGSGYGEKQPFSPGQQIINWDEDGFWLEIGCRVYALVRSETTAQTHFYGRFDPWDLFDQVDETVYQKSYYPYGLDNASGGTRGTFQELFEKLPYRDSDDWCLYDDHCFIPTCSSLGIPIANIEQTIHGNSALLSLSPFDELHYPTTNEAHIDINAGNKRWFMRAVLENHDADGDGFDDYQEYYLGTAFDDAGDRLSLVTAVDVPPGGLVNVSWESYPNAAYSVYRTEALDGVWQLIDRIPAADAAGMINRSYAIPAESSGAFFRVTAEAVDPVQD